MRSPTNCLITSSWCRNPSRPWSRTVLSFSMRSTRSPAARDAVVGVNSSVENIGARRLQTVMERVLDEISFAAPDRAGETLKIDAAYVQQHVGDLARNTDLSR